MLKIEVVGPVVSETKMRPFVIPLLLTVGILHGHDLYINFTCVASYIFILLRLQKGKMEVFPS